MYARQLIPHNFGLVKRLITEVDFNQLFFNIKVNLLKDLFLDRDYRDSEVIIPNSVYIDPTYNCNRTCRGCYVEKKGNVISYDLTERVIDSSLNIGISYIAWLGGEPFLPNVQDLVLSITSNFSKMNFVLCTNGDFVDEKLANRISEIRNLATLVSVDGLEENHDWRRGRGSYDQTIKALGLLKDRNELTGYMATIMLNNYMEISSEKFVETMIQKGCLIGSYSLVICGSGNISEGLDSEKYGLVISRLRKIAKEMPIYIISTDFGYMGRGKIRNSKRLVAVTVSPLGEIRSERGGEPLGKLGVDGSLDEIIFSDKTQKIFRDKINNNGVARDRRLQIIRDLEIVC